MVIKLRKVKTCRRGELFLTENLGYQGKKVEIGDEAIFTNIGPNRQYTAYGRYAGFNTQGYGCLRISECSEFPFAINMDALLMMEDNSRSGPAENLVSFLRAHQENPRNCTEHNVDNAWNIYLVEEK